MQEAMIAIVRNLGSLRSPAALQSWVRRIAVREALRACDANRAIAIDPSTLEAVPAIPSEATAVEIRDVLASLAPEHRAVLVLRHLHGLGEDEMAEVLGVATGTVKSRLHRARQSFRARWER